jgi:hypothetical protein
MGAFSIGDRVIIRFGNWQGHRGEIVERQQAQVFRINIERGPSLLYSSAGLQEVNPVPPLAFSLPLS